MSVANGAFNVQIGTGTMQAPPGVAFSTLTFDTPYWLEVTVGAETLAPRQPLTSAPYAQRAARLSSDALYSTASGSYTLASNTGYFNTSSGWAALWSNTTASNNTASGAYALFSNKTGGNNVALGYSAGYGVTSGSNNIALGSSAGLALTTGSNNIDIGNAGVAGESGIIRIGTPGTQTDTYIAGNVSATGAVSGTSTYGHAIRGDSPSNIALLGINGAATTDVGGNGGVYGISGTGFGVGGESSSGDGILGSSSTGYAGHFYGAVLATGLITGNVGVKGTSVAGHALRGDSTSNIAVLGINGAATTDVGGNGGVYGISGTGFGVGGESSSGDGILGSSSTGYAGHFYGKVLATGTISASSFITTSDRNAKENFSAINAREILDKVAALPITRWNFKTEAATEHLGPMAQDFYAAFQVGPDDKHIATVDESGVALAAIQGLFKMVQERDEQLRAQAAKIAKVEQQLERLAGLLSQLEKPEMRAQSRP